MQKDVLNYIEACEGWKTAIKSLHWGSSNMSQHKLCDDIADRIAEFQDQVSEVEQSISGRLSKTSGFKGKPYKVSDLKKFVSDVISDTNSFRKKLDGMGDKYVGMKSDAESFISDMQRNLYLADFTMKEDKLRERVRSMVNEARPKNLANVDDVDKFMGKKPTTMKTRISHIYKIVKKYGIDSRFYSDDHWQAIDDYHRAISSLGCEVDMKPCADLRHSDSMESDGGYTDYDPTDNMPRSKQYAIRITFDDGMVIDGYIKCMAAGTVEDPFARYDTCMVLWPKSNRVLENKNMSKQMRLTEAELKQVIKEAAIKILSETPLNYDIDNFSGRWNKSEPSDEELALADSAANGDYLDNPFNPPNSWDDDEWVDGDKDMENDYSWSLYHRMNNVGKSPVDRQHDIMNAAQNRRDHAAYWTDRDNERGNRLMGKWVDGKRDLNDLEDADFSYDPYKYNESKNSMKVTEAELKQIVKEAAISLIKEYSQKQANAKGSCGEVDESIEIDPKNKGKFNATKRATGKSTEELKHSKNPLTRKRATFAANAKKWAKNKD